jgi:hypothetical protein
MPNTMVSMTRTANDSASSTKVGSRVQKMRSDPTPDLLPVWDFGGDAGNRKPLEGPFRPLPEMGLQGFT